MCKPSITTAPYLWVLKVKKIYANQKFRVRVSNPRVI